MSKYIINGNRPLNGVVDIKAAKNSVLPLLSAAILTDQTVTLHNCPDILDIRNMALILECLNVSVNFDKDDIIINSSNIMLNDIPPALAKQLRSSIFMLGPMLSRFKKARFYYPGGCNIGARPIDIHIDCLRQLNVNITDNNIEYIDCNSDNIKSGKVYLSYPSVGATENVIMLTVMLEGVTNIFNAAREPEITDLCKMLNGMGAQIKGEGTSVIEITGVKSLNGIDFTPVYDRIAAGTYVVAALMCGGNIQLNNVNSRLYDTMLRHFIKSPCNFLTIDDKMYIEYCPKREYNNCIQTKPFPGFATDMQAIVMALLSKTQGKYVIVENVFETRFSQIAELNKLGADIVSIGSVAVINGVEKLHGNDLLANDLRAGAALVLAGLSAEGITTVDNVCVIERGYHHFDETLRKLGAAIIKTD